MYFCHLIMPSGPVTAAVTQEFAARTFWYCFVLVHAAFQQP